MDTAERDWNLGWGFMPLRTQSWSLADLDLETPLRVCF
jgi:hypothetical protein